jgi:hypothetical protein
MKLENLEKTTLLCIEYHKLWHNDTKVGQLTDQLRRIESKQFNNETQYNGLYLGQGKKTFGNPEENT